MPLIQSCSIDRIRVLSSSNISQTFLGQSFDPALIHALHEVEITHNQ